MVDWIVAGAAVVSLLVSGLALWRSVGREDAEATDKRIDERIDLRLGSDIAVIKNTLATIQTSIAGQADLVKHTIAATTSAINETARTMVELQDR